ncbi:MAG: indolepyruvate oxidoreductase subunit beta [Thermodesulfovibrionales bacterium]
MDRTMNLFLCGVGGQGILLASEVISSACMLSGFDVKQSEVHGMAQRGGSVISHIRFGTKVYSPLIEPGDADIVVSFELLEALRYLPYMNKDTKVIVNTQKILPSPVATGADTYPADVLEQLQKRGLTVFPVDAFELAREAGETRAVNMVLVGGLSLLLPLEEQVFLQVLQDRLPGKIRAVNTAAFLKGREVIGKLRAR